MTATATAIDSIEDLGRLLASLNLRPRRSGSGWSCLCPVHEDRNPSLSITVRDGRLLACCYAGCDFRDIRAALGGVTVRHDLAPMPPPPDHSVYFSANWREMVRASFASSGSTIVQERERAWGVPSGGLVALGAIWAVTQAAVAVPMWDGTGQSDPIGARIRSDSGNKWAVKGSKQGLFMPRDRAGLDGPLFLPEGLTDTAAMVGLGLDAIGRPSCTGGRDQLRAVVAAEPRDRVVVIVADADEPGRLGARMLAESLGRPTVTIAPPIGTKDVREWVQRGGTAASIRFAAKTKTPR